MPSNVSNPAAPTLFRAVPAASSSVCIHIIAGDYVEFDKVDERIVHTEGWLESNPMRTNITVPTDAQDEIIERLMSYPGVHAVNHELTEEGKREQKRLKEQSPFFDAIAAQKAKKNEAPEAQKEGKSCSVM